MKSEFDLSKVHQINLKMLKEIDRICRKHQIQYLLDAGTLLGAVRHQGFIPWDDDVDIAFTRPNYELFCKVAAQELPDEMDFLSYDELNNGTVFYDFTSRIIYKNSQMHENSDEMKFYQGKLNHLWVDLFVIDHLPQGSLNGSFTILLHTLIYGLAMGHRYKLDFKKYSWINKIFVGVLSLTGKIIPMKLIFKMQKAVARKDIKSKSSRRYYSNYQPDYLYVTLKEEWCEETVDLPFCDTHLMAPKGWHQVLSWIYGDYQKLPPKEQQVPAHSSMEIQIFD